VNEQAGGCNGGCLLTILVVACFWAVVLFIAGLALGWSTLTFP